MRRIVAGGLLLGFAALFARCTWIEARTSSLEARPLARLARSADFRVERGPSPAIAFPGAGPYDERLGYSRIPAFTARLLERGFRVEEQARLSRRALALARAGLNLPYREKTVAGLDILDRRGRLFFAAAHPGPTWSSFEAIPQPIFDALLFVENRELLSPDQPHLNPAIEWDRFGRAVLQYPFYALGLAATAPGGSTLATQMEKFRHSPGGVTDSPGEKLRQIASATLRAYRDGERTLAARREIAADYLNSIPLAAVPGRGEVIGLAQGLEAWFGAEFDQVNAALHSLAAGGERQPTEQQARAYRQVLSLLLAAQRPTHYLLRDRSSLAARTDGYLRLLADARAISPELRDRALAVRLEFADASAPRPEAGPAPRERQPWDAARTPLAGLLGASLYQLDRLDLTVETSLDREAQEAAIRALRELRDPARAAQAGLLGPRLLEGSDPSGVVYALTLYERAPGLNLLRVQADTLDRPLDGNDGVKLDLGSTAKLRTLATYLELVAELHRRYAGLSPQELRRVEVDRSDPLTRFVVDRLADHPGLPLPALLDRALERRYSASPSEGFFTAGGLHHFANFRDEDDGRVLSVREAFRDSVNLVFIRLMRDVAQHHVFADRARARALRDPADPGRRELLRRFADLEGRRFLARFYRDFERGGPRPPQARPARRHPLELWLAAYLERHPGASLEEVLDASAPARLDAYGWLFSSRRRKAQDSRIRTVLEIDAFREIHRHWRRLGYPFETLVPSLASAIGASADRPAALAELLGIIAGGGVRAPTTRTPVLRFAAGTPYETALVRPPAAGERVMREEVASALRAALVETVERGTARRARQALPAGDGSFLEVGGKTGTGDHRWKRFAPGGRLLEARPVNRTATFAFLIGDRYYGVVTAFVPGPRAADYRFTSALPVQVFKELAPDLLARLERPEATRLGG